jgi:molybdopterin-biosynthesis enzyme MoeA-like protein
MMATSQIVVTCGGVGPTVDDCTVEAVGHAVGARLALNTVFSASIRKHFGDKVCCGPQNCCLKPTV